MDVIKGERFCILVCLCSFSFFPKMAESDDGMKRKRILSCSVLLHCRSIHIQELHLRNNASMHYREALESEALGE